MTRPQLNHTVRKLAHGVLGLDEETYREIVRNIDAKSGGHISRCDDEMANLVLLTLRHAADARRGVSHTPKIQNEHQQRKIAKLGFLLGWSWHDIARFCFKQTGNRSTKQCNPKDLSKCVNGMVNIINGKLADGSLTLGHADLAAFLKYTQQHNEIPPKDGGIRKITEPLTNDVRG